MAEAEIYGAVVAAGHDGQAQLVVHVKYENEAIGSVTLDADPVSPASRLSESRVFESVRSSPSAD